MVLLKSNCVPSEELYFGEKINDENLFPSNVLYTDTEDKIVKWVYGSSNKLTDTVVNGINFVNNAKHDTEPYYPKRINIEF